MLHNLPIYDFSLAAHTRKDGLETVVDFLGTGAHLKHRKSTKVPRLFPSWGRGLGMKLCHSALLISE